MGSNAEAALRLVASKPLLFGSRRWDSNPRPAVYETAALPLSYAGLGVVNGHNAA